MRAFIGSVTHEMKTPLAGIRNLLQTAAAGKLPEDRHEELMRMGLSETERLEHMIENVLIAGRLRSDHQPLQMTVTGLRDFFEGFLAHRRESMMQAQEVILDGDVPEVDVLVDPDALRVILENLVDNGLKYGGKDPRVTIGLCEKGDRVVVEVRDEGVGFEPSEAETLFAPFHRAMSGSSSRHGTGLGLSIARTLARRMGGDLTAHSDGPGRGSRFEVILSGRPR
jgi:signal transduction histidine kinase